MIDRQLATRSPRLCPPATPWLFPRRDGSGPMHDDGLSKRIRTRIRRETGLAVNAHLFRHLSAKLLLDANPGGYEAVRHLLGHARLSSTLNVYTGLEAARGDAALRPGHRSGEAAMTATRPALGGWPEADRAIWTALVRQGGPLDDAGALSHVRATTTEIFSGATPAGSLARRHPTRGSRRGTREPGNAGASAGMAGVDVGSGAGQSIRLCSTDRSASSARAAPRPRLDAQFRLRRIWIGGPPDPPARARAAGSNRRRCCSRPASSSPALGRQPPRPSSRQPSGAATAR